MLKLRRYLAVGLGLVMVATGSLNRSAPVGAVTDPVYTLPFFQTYALTCGFQGQGGNCPWYTSHQGTDYQLGNAEAAGEYVVAAADGTVIQVNFQPVGAGHYIVIEHGNGRLTRYLHLQSQPSVAYGPTVSRGQLIGYEGNTGGPWCQNADCSVTGSPYHLHFETAINAIPGDPGSGTTINPYPYSPQYNNLWTTNPPSYAEGETIGVSSWASNRIDVFVRDNAAHLRHRWWDGVQWNPVGTWENTNANRCLAGGPTAVSRISPNRIDVFARECGTDDLLRISWNGGWGAWEARTEHCLKSEPAVTSWGGARLDVFFRNCSDNIQWIYSLNNGSTWTSATLPGCTRAAPGAATWGGNHLAVFVRGCDNGNQLHYNYNVGAGFQAVWAALGGCLGSGPGADAWAVNRLDVFVRGCTDASHHKWSDSGGANWSDFVEPSPCITSAPGATSRALGILDVFARGCGNRELFQKWYNGSQWSGWNLLIAWP